MQIPPPSRGIFYALTREVKFLCMDREAPYPRFCIKIQFVGQSIHFFHFSYFKKIIHTHFYTLYLKIEFTIYIYIYI